MATKRTKSSQATPQPARAKAPAAAPKSGAKTAKPGDAKRQPVGAKAAAKGAAPKAAVKGAVPKAAAKGAAPKAAGVQVQPEATSGPLEAGAPAPSFELMNQAGERVSSKALKGRRYVVYFYPKDDTPGCTKEASGFQALAPAFEAAGVAVLGVSPDSAASHARFAEKYALGFQLLSDPEKELARAYGVWVMKKNYGREYLGIQRATFLVGAGGRVERVWPRVRVEGHAEAVLKVASEA